MNRTTHILSLAIVLFLLIGCENSAQKSPVDWLIDPSPYKSFIRQSDDGREIYLENGLIRRTIRVVPNVATTSFCNLITGEEFLRSVRPEAEIEIDHKRFKIGGLRGQPVHNYLAEQWLEKMISDSPSFKYSGYTIGSTKKRFEWKKRREWMTEDVRWPPAGKSLTLSFEADSELVSSLPYLKQITVKIHYEIYDGIPLMCKYLTVENHSSRIITINRFKSEILALVEAESSVGNKHNWLLPNITVETDYAFGGSMSIESCLGKSVFWETDSLYRTQVNYQRVMPCLLECRPKYGPEQRIKPGDKFESFRTFELLHDSWDRERKGLARRRMYRTIAPWVTENPILMHVRNSDDESVKLAIDQCAEVGFEMVIITFGSGFNIEDESDENLRRMKRLADYAHKRGIALGGYSLLASRSVGGGNDVVPPRGMKPTFGNSPCLESNWGRDYFRKLYAFFEKTGMDVLEHDGSYPGDLCASTDHPGHRGVKDSQWNQFVKIRNFYRWCRSKGIYLNVPDWYFLNGSSKTGMGYRETNWSLPRKYQEIIERQNIYDGTWEKTPSMGWMFVPLTQYHGGGEAATIEPLKEHLVHYQQRLANLFGAGVQACFRGPRLFDSIETKKVVKKWVDFYKKHRAILNSDIIHVLRADGRDIDCILHVNPRLKEKGLAMIYNPTTRFINRTISLPLYYTGLKNDVVIYERDGKRRRYKLNRKYNVRIDLSIQPGGVTWFVIEGK